MSARPQGNAEEGLLLMSIRLMKCIDSTVAGLASPKQVLVAGLASPKQVLVPGTGSHGMDIELLCCQFLFKLLLLLRPTQQCVRQQQSNQPLLHLSMALHPHPIVQTDST